MPTKKAEVKSCVFCVQGIDEIPMHSSDVLRKFISGQSKIYPRRKTGTCARHQRRVAREIKRAREMGFLPYRGQ